ncbi:MAG: glycosyltransferase family 4 protein [Candidatus Sumerlaeaceae bacterium]|nr:glycosyltransferase family 4 protein [Candidatus Sumerlaeaceae bacterium]
MIEHTGIGTYLRGLLPALVSAGKAQGIKFALLGSRDKLQQCLMLDDNIVYEQYQADVYSLRHQLCFPEFKNAVAYHFPHYDVPLLFSRPFFVTIHDIIPLLAPAYRFRFVYKSIVRLLASKATKSSLHVFVPSQHVADSLVRELGLPASKITITPYAPLPLFCANTQVETHSIIQRLGVSQPYFLCVSLHKPHKNLEFLLRAFRQLHTRGTCVHSLVLVGTGLRNRAKLVQLVAQLFGTEHKAWVRILDDHLSDAEMCAIYRGADAVIHPSMVEGFGMPVVEAQAVGVPVVVPDLPWARETAGEGAAYFRASEVDSLVQVLELLVTDGSIRSDLVRLAKTNVQRFSWSLSASNVLDIYKSCL